MSMDEALIPHYERELLFFRQILQEFAKKYPNAAGRLLLEPNRSADSEVERLIESAALLAGSVQHKLHDEFPEITTPLLQAIYPHNLAPIPSMGILQFELDPARAQLPNGFLIDRHSLLHTEPVDGLPCKFTTAYPVTLWPIALASADFHAAPFPRGLTAPPGSKAALRLTFECTGPLKFAELSLERLRLHLHGDVQVLPALYELLFNHALQVAFRPVAPESAPATVTLAPQACLHQVGFETLESLLPYAPASRLSYRLLTELFVFPAKFWFMDLSGWKEVCRRGWQRHCEVVVFFDRTHNILEKSIDLQTFRLGCTPVVNLFKQVAEPVALKSGGFEYPVVPDATQTRGLEVYTVDRVTSTSPGEGAPREIPPFFSFQHPRDLERSRVFWHASREPSRVDKDHGTVVKLHLVDLDFNPIMTEVAVLEVSTTCTNRDLPNQLRMAGDAIAFELEAAAPLAHAPRCLRSLNPPLRSRPRRGHFWHLVSHFSLNYLSVVEGSDGLKAFQELLSLYDFSDAEAGQQHLAPTRQFIEGVIAVQSRRVIGRLTRDHMSSFCRGFEVALELDDDKYPGIGMFLFASVLERFLACYVSNNSFTKMVARLKNRKDHFKKWPPRPGDLQTL
ncbi:MAG: type VI secretion system baseplate subunit TssF [Planctomycetes bacterium]|nr:type VI secretion system baseplate subunit TssF [Planctomycetota bacterium]